MLYNVSSNGMVVEEVRIRRMPKLRQLIKIKADFKDLFSQVRNSLHRVK